MVLNNCHNHAELFADLAKEYGYTVFIGRDLTFEEYDTIANAFIRLYADFRSF